MNEEIFQRLQFDSAGLIPAVVQDYYTGEVLTVAYMNEESLRISIAEQRTCFFSRSRKTLWRKGETSGNVQHILRIIADCDFDALVVQVAKDGPACHLGTESCFSSTLYAASPAYEKRPFSLDELYRLIQERKQQLPAGSYTTYLFEKGLEKILKKVGEESTEVIIAAMKGGDDETIYEAADLTYHMLVLLCQLGIPPARVRDELAKRHIIDHKVKQESMQ